MDDTQKDTIDDGGPVVDASTLRTLLHDVGGDLATDDPLAEIRALEELKNALCARQARLTVQAHHRQRDKDTARGIDRATTARFVGSQIALAQRRSPHLGSRLLGLAHALTEEMPHTYAALAAGVINERDATALVAQTAYLTREDRTAVDAALADDLGHTSHRRLVAEATKHAYAADPQAFVHRRAKAEADRRVTLRPAPDCMAWLTALLPVKDGVACYAALKTAAAAHSDQPRGQVMADTLVQRVTGHAPADGSADIHVDLLMPIDTLTGDTPAHVPDYGPIPADLAREWVNTTNDTAAEVRTQIRRIFTYPDTGDLIGMDSHARTYPGLLAHLIRLRDHTCRTPWCDAPIKHIDHIQAHATGGETCERNGQGLCARCNQVKEHPDINITGHAGETTTTTGSLTATSRPPAPPGMPPPTRSHLDRALIDISWRIHRIQWRAA
ncbi:HNH endonuclease [Flexivirga oryzae]|uniref:HNH nuclease domain-containing protein n=1 Tax=Flexivirga oryzae TaxID=1794944 RepID=A0A839MZB1_9MICO|nr:DUF222 domain-containing protein [Flexivirga oryzae]MBB2890800.1 hypothetical protein [Flexivirga oryzae]